MELGYWGSLVLLPAEQRLTAPLGMLVHLARSNEGRGESMEF